MNPAQLLDLAELIARAGTGRPRTTYLRRAVATTYYALFHLLTRAGAARLTASSELRHALARQFDHKAMKTASRLIADHAPSIRPFAAEVPPELRRVAELFIVLQEARHAADYDGRNSDLYNRDQVLDRIARTRAAFADWAAVRDHPATEVYVLSMLFHPLAR